nr:YhjD/YihY/BrkB family envelope integrity protein [Gordonia humi]
MPALLEAIKQWPVVGRIFAMQDHYTARRGNVYAAAISFTGILALVPILMVSFAIAGFVLASRPELITEITDAVLKNIPGDLGKQLNTVIDSAIASRATVGVLGLASAALTGLGWMGLTRNALSDMWGGRRKRNAVVGKLVDLVMFVALGLLFVLTIALTVATTGPVGQWVIDQLGIEQSGGGRLLLRVASIVASVIATWLLFSVVLSRMPMQTIPIRVVMPAAVVVAVFFEILKSLGAVYLRSVLSSPAGAAFGPIIGVMVFAYLAVRVVLYATAWTASNPDNVELLTDDEVESNGDETEHEPVYLAPVYEVSPTSKTRSLVTAAGLGAAIGAVLGRRRR